MKTTTHPIPAIGTCEVCKKVNMGLVRTCFHYDLKCECHSPNHFDLVDHCADCTPNTPLTTKVSISTANI